MWVPISVQAAVATSICRLWCYRRAKALPKEPLAATVQLNRGAASRGVPITETVVVVWEKHKCPLLTLLPRPHPARSHLFHTLPSLKVHMHTSLMSAPLHTSHMRGARHVKRSRNNPIMSHYSRCEINQRRGPLRNAPSRDTLPRRAAAPLIPPLQIAV